MAIGFDFEKTQKGYEVFDYISGRTVVTVPSRRAAVVVLWFADRIAAVVNRRGVRL